MRRLIVLSLALVPGLALAAPDKKSMSKTKVDVVEDAAPVKDVLRRLEQRHGLNYVVSERVLEGAGTVTVKLKRVPLDMALEAICSACGLSLEYRGPILVILPKSSRAALPKVRTGLRPKRRKGAQLPSLPPRAPAPKPRARSRRRARTDLGVQAMETGDVEEVDLKNGRLQLRIAGGIKRDFYLPPNVGPDPKMQSARLRLALSRLKKGHRVALLFRYDDDKPVITSLIGGRSLQAGSPYGRRRGRQPARPRKARKPIKGPVNPRTAPESNALPDGVLVGRFVEKKGEVVRVRRADGKVIDCYLPAKTDAGRRKKALAVFSKLEANSQVFLTYERKDGKVVIKDPGITEAPQPKPEKKAAPKKQ